MSLSIRRATIEDLETIVDFNCKLAAETEAKQLDRAVLIPGVQAVLSDLHKGFYTVALIENEIVGQILITYEWSDWRNGWFWWIQSVFVRSTARGKGVFRALYRHLEDLATQDPQVIGLRLYVEGDNQIAQATYRKVGMEDESYKLMAVYPLAGKISNLRPLTDANHS